MTTIAYRDKVLAGDRRSTDGSLIVPGRYRKVYKNKCGWLYGAAGTSGPCEALNAYMASCPDFSEELPPRGKYTAIVVSPDGRVYNIDNGWIELLPKDIEFYVVGSGAPAALGALWMGANAVEAVEIASEIDNCTGGGVDHVSLN
jgi:hypothetical protein